MKITKRILEKSTNLNEKVGNAVIKKFASNLVNADDIFDAGIKEELMDVFDGAETLEEAFGKDGAKVFVKQFCAVLEKDLVKL